MDHTGGRYGRRLCRSNVEVMTAAAILATPVTILRIPTSSRSLLFLASSNSVVIVMLAAG